MIINPFPTYKNGQLQFDDGRFLLREFYSIPTNSIDTIKEQSKILTESFDKHKSSDETSVFMNCILQKCETENRNGRYYPRSLLEREINKYQELIDEGRALSHSKHPDNSLVEFDECSHRITKAWWEDNTLMGTVEIIGSPGYFKLGVISCPGDIIINLLRKGVKMGISSRGVGSLEERSGKNVVMDDFELIAFDLVSSPSTPGAFLFDNNKEMAENIEEQVKSGIFDKKSNFYNDPFIKNLNEFLK